MMDKDKEGSPEYWRRMEEIYHAALPLAAIERVAFVGHACAGDVALLEEVNSLLAADDSASTFLQEPVFTLGLEVLADESLHSTEIVAEPTRSAPVDRMIGVSVGGRYEIVEKLGGGGMGDVYLARDKPEMLGRRVVIKLLREERLTNEWIVTKFRQEAEALTKIDDPGVVGIIDAGTLSNGKPFLVMQYVEGQSLRDHLKKRQEAEEEVEPQEVAEIIRQAGRTLTAAHQAGIVHRDLKPENIMLRRNVSGDLQVKVIDFGIAKVKNSVLAPSTDTIHIIGTWQYMSPEQLRREKATPTSDVYALGVIAYEMLTGRRPFNARNPVQLAESQRDGVRAMPRDLRPDDVSEEAQLIILKALSYRPAERYQSARAFGDDLARALLVEEEGEVVPVDLGASTLEIDDKNRPVNESVNSAKATLSENKQSTPQAMPELPARSYRPWLISALAVVLIIALSFTLWHAFKSSDKQLSQAQSQPATPPAPERTLIYWLSVKRPRDKKPFDSTGERIFDTGSQFWFNIQATQDGALYLFGEGHVGDKPSELNTMFPTPKSGKGDARIAANRIGSVTTDPYQFRGERGVIYLWIIWATQPVPLLDEIVKKSFDTGGAISDPSQQTALRTFIEQHREPKPDVITDTLRGRVTLKGRNEILVDMRKLEYQP